MRAEARRSLQPWWNRGVLLGLLCLVTVGAAQQPWAPSQVQAQQRWRSRSLKAGQSLNRLLRSLGVSGRDCQSAERALSRLFPVAREARPGDQVRVSLGRQGRLEALVYQSRRRGVYHLRRRGDRLLAGRGPLPGDQEEAEAADRVALEGPPPWAQPPEGAQASEPLRAFFAASSPAQRQAAQEQLTQRHSWFSLRRALRRAWEAQALRPGVHSREALTVQGERAPFVVYVPEGYDPHKPAPLHISLHGLGGTGPGTCRLRWQQPQPGMLLVCPTHLGGAWQSPLGRRRVWAVYRRVLRDFAVDTDRVVLGGFSNGGNGTWRLGAAWPWLWAGLTPRAGAAPPHEEARQDLAHLPMFILHGDQDRSISVDHSRRMVDWLVEQGRPPHYIEVEGGGHDFFSEFNPQVHAWMLEQRRGLPRAFSYHLRNQEQPRRVYWVVARGQGNLLAQVKRSPWGTTVVLESEGLLSSLELFLLPGVVTAGRPVKVVLNQELIYHGTPQPQVEAALDWMRLTGDLEHLAWARLRLLPGATQEAR